jgi:hypothetical protein
MSFCEVLRGWAGFQGHLLFCTVKIGFRSDFQHKRGRLSNCRCVQSVLARNPGWYSSIWSSSIDRDILRCGSFARTCGRWANKRRRPLESRTSGLIHQHENASKARKMEALRSAKTTLSACTRTELCALHQASDFFGVRCTSGVLKQGKERRKRSLVKRERNIAHESSDKHADPPAERDGL